MKYKKILVVTSRYPVPVRGGDKLRIFQIIKYLSKKNKVDLISIGNSKTKINYINKQFVFKNTFSNKIYQIIKSIILREPMQIGLFKLPEMKDKVNIALVGNPNAGKSSLFNLLTGSKQKVGNWPGVTVDKKTGSFSHQGQSYEVVDLPGIYTLMLPPEEGALDAQIAREYLLAHQSDIIVNTDFGKLS